LEDKELQEKFSYEVGSFTHKTPTGADHVKFRAKGRKEKENYSKRQHRKCGGLGSYADKSPVVRPEIRIRQSRERDIFAGDTGKKEGQNAGHIGGSRARGRTSHGTILHKEDRQRTPGNVLVNHFGVERKVRKLIR